MDNVDAVTLYKTAVQDRYKDWIRQRACIGMPTETFYPPTEKGEQEIAASICEQCPVRADCLEYALVMETKSPGQPQLGQAGVWGHAAVDRRRVMRKIRSEYPRWAEQQLIRAVLPTLFYIQKRQRTRRREPAALLDG